MKKYAGSFLTFMSVVFTTLFVMGCTVPSPLYGTWSDNVGNQIMFLNDGTFSAEIHVPKDNPGEGEEAYITVNEQGTYNAVDNALVINTSASDTNKASKFNTEWDLRGAMLYLTWTVKTEEEGMKTVSLTLYHNAK